VKYIVVNPKRLTVSISYSPAAKYPSIPVSDYVSNFVFPDLHGMMWQFEIDEVDREDKRRGRKVAHRIEPPDPALMALAYIMWQGILQGMAWDAVKSLVRAAFHRLRRDARPPRPLPLSREQYVEYGLSWERYIEKRSAHRLFIGLRKEFRVMTPEERERVALPRKGGYREAVRFDARRRRMARVYRIPKDLPPSDGSRRRSRRGRKRDSSRWRP